MSTRILIAGLCGLFFFAAAYDARAQADAVPEAAASFDERELLYRVLLDGKEIGSHRYNLRSSGDTRLVESEAAFDVKFLFFNAYSYRHTLSARWRGECLQSLEADTNANGKKLAVSGQLRDESFVVKTGDETTTLPACVMNFAYWNPLILEQAMLLNPQTGDYLEVEVTRTGEESISIDGRSLATDAFRIRAKDMRIDLWYSQGDGQWVALESLTKEGRIIRYELIRGWITDFEETGNG
ncbi:MAG: DUF6134 family protein [Woeseiaceae bacterium]|nr:DUF6134 family protein [Woeseiaceae bacterium]